MEHGGESVMHNQHKASAGATAQLQATGGGVAIEDNRSQTVAQLKLRSATGAEAPVQRKANNTGLPDNLKSGIENLSGHSMDDVKVHYNSSAPAQLNAHAYAQGNQIHVAPGQEKHVPHEAWHVVQQKEGRVKPTMQMKGKVNVNDDSGLEKEADVMGAKALQMRTAHTHTSKPAFATGNTFQLYRVDARTGDTVTDNGHYRMNPGAPSTLLAHHGVPGPRPGGFFRISGTQTKVNSRGEQINFQKYEAKANLYNAGWTLIATYPANGLYYQRLQALYPAYDGPNDCGMYATGVIKNNPRWGFKEAYNWSHNPAGPWTGLPENFDSYHTLRPVANSKRDKEIEPKTGAALLIHPPAHSTPGVGGTSKHPGRMAFHVAPVVITAGSDHITNEADAGHGGRAKPHWKISGSKKPGQSWHESYKDAYKDSRNKRRAQGLDENNVWPQTTQLEP